MATFGADFLNIKYFYDLLSNIRYAKHIRKAT